MFWMEICSAFKSRILHSIITGLNFYKGSVIGFEALNTMCKVSEMTNRVFCITRRPIYVFLVVEAHFRFCLQWIIHIKTP